MADDLNVKVLADGVRFEGLRPLNPESKQGLANRLSIQSCWPVQVTNFRDIGFVVVIIGSWSPEQLECWEQMIRDAMVEPEESSKLTRRQSVAFMVLLTGLTVLAVNKTNWGLIIGGAIIVLGTAALLLPRRRE